MWEEGLRPLHFLVVKEGVDYKGARTMRQRNRIAWRQIISVMEVGSDVDDEEEGEGGEECERAGRLPCSQATIPSAAHRGLWKCLRDHSPCYGKS
jgi:hypothetical protein